MGSLMIHGGSGGNSDSSDTTVKASQVLAGKTYIGSDTDGEVGTGTLTLPNNALPANKVLSGEKYTYIDGDTVKTVTGTMANVGALDTTTKVRAANNNIILGMTNGAHITNRSSTEKYPEVQASYANVVTALGGKDNIAPKIVGGQTILGVGGTYKGVGTAIASEILKGKTATVAGTSAPKVITGTMEDRGTYQYCTNVGGSVSAGYFALNGIPEGYYHRTDRTQTGYWQPEVRVDPTKLLNYIRKDSGVGNYFPFGIEKGTVWGHDIVTDVLKVPLDNIYYYEGGWKVGFSDVWFRKWYNPGISEDMKGTVVHNKYNTQFVKASKDNTYGYVSGLRFGSYEDGLDLTIDVAGYNHLYVEVSNVTIGDYERFRIRATEGGKKERTDIRNTYYVKQGGVAPSGETGVWTMDPDTKRVKLVLDVTNISALLYFSFDRETWYSSNQTSNTFYVHKIWFD